MKNLRPIRRAQREQRKMELPRSHRPRCVFCFEMDHTAGRHHDSLLKFPVCQRHHDVLSDLRRDAEISMLYEPHPVKRVALALRSTSVFLQMLGEATWRWADSLDEAARAGKRRTLLASAHKCSPKAGPRQSKRLGSVRPRNRHRDDARH
jgi:hypothetical protein